MVFVFIQRVLVVLLFDVFQKVCFYVIFFFYLDSFFVFKFEYFFQELEGCFGNLDFVFDFCGVYTIRNVDRVVLNVV